MLARPSRGAIGIPRHPLPSGATIGNGFYLTLKEDAFGGLTLGPISPWKISTWPLVIGILIALFPPISRLLWKTFTRGAANFNDPFFFNGFQLTALCVGFATSAMFFFFYTLVKQWTAVTRFDQAQNLIHRQQTEPTLLRHFLGLRYRLEEVRMKISDARALQLCLGGHTDGDSERPGYDWWQLLIVGQGEPPFRAIIAQSAARQNLSDTGQRIAAYLSVLWVDDSDFRSPEIDNATLGPGRLDSQGAYITTGSTDDPTIDPQLVLEAARFRQGKKAYAIIAALLLTAFLAFAAFQLWKLNREGVPPSQVFPGPPPGAPIID
jgi:hypothetical protein